MASPTTFPLGPGQGTDNVTSLPAGQAKALGVIGSANAVYFDYTIAPMQFTPGTGASGTIDILIAVSEDNTHYTDGISPTSTSDQSGSITNQMTLARQIQVESNAVVRAQSFGLYNALGGVQPMFWTLIVRNNTGVAFSATASGHICQYSTLNYSSSPPIVYA